MGHLVPRCGFVLVFAIGCIVACSSPSNRTATPALDGDGGGGGNQGDAASDAGDLTTDAASSEGGQAVADGAAPTPGSATLSGALAQGKTAKDAFAFNKKGRLTVKITDYAGACSYEEMNNAHNQSSSYLELYLTAYPGMPGMVAIGPGADATYFVRDATCNIGSSVQASAGSVTVTAVTATEVTGTFSLTMGGGQVTGTFTAPVCGGGTLVGSGGACLP